MVFVPFVRILNKQIHTYIHTYIRKEWLNSNVLNRYMLEIICE